MVQPLSNDTPLTCALCEGTIVPFGEHLQMIFIVDVVGPICVACAEATVPSRVQHARDGEARMAAAHRRER